MEAKFCTYRKKKVKDKVAGRNKKPIAFRKFYLINDYFKEKKYKIYGTEEEMIRSNPHQESLYRRNEYIWKELINQF
jgi:hypothetical protein